MIISDSAFAESLTYLFNAVEGFAIFFVRGVADEELVFPSLGMTYCNAIESLSPYIALTRKKVDSYCDVIELYGLWRTRAKKLGLVGQLKDLTTKIKGIDDRRISPIGTD